MKRRPKQPSNNVPPKNEQRSPDQDAAMEKAFVAAKLPEEDRREHFEEIGIGEPPNATPEVLQATIDKQVQQPVMVEPAKALDAKTTVAVPPPGAPVELQDPKHWESLSGRPMEP